MNKTTNLSAVDTRCYKSNIISSILEIWELVNKKNQRRIIFEIYKLYIIPFKVIQFFLLTKSIYDKTIYLMFYSAQYDSILIPFSSA